MNRIQLKRPVLLLFCGVAGSGKTTLALALLRVLKDSCYLSKDLIQTPFTRSRQGEEYERIRKGTFQLLLEWASLHLKAGKIPIIDAPFTRNHHYRDETREWTRFFEEVAQEIHAFWLPILVLPPSPSELRRRLEKRNYPWDREKLKNWEEWLKYEPFEPLGLPSHTIRIVSDRDPGILVEELLQKIQKEIPNSL